MAADALADTETVEYLCATQRDEIRRALSMDPMSLSPIATVPVSIGMLNQALSSLTPDLVIALLRPALTTAHQTQPCQQISIPDVIALLAPDLHSHALRACAPCIDAERSLHMRLHSASQVQLLRSVLPTLCHITHLGFDEVTQPDGAADLLHTCCALPDLRSMHATLVGGGCCTRALPEAFAAAHNLEAADIVIPKNPFKSCKFNPADEETIIMALAQREAEATARPLCRLVLTGWCPRTAVLCCALRQLTGLQELRLVNTMVLAAPLAECLATLPDMRHLALDRVDWCDVDEGVCSSRADRRFTEFMAAVGSMSQLQALQLTAAIVPSVTFAAQSMRLHLARSTQLTQLELSCIVDWVKLGVLGELLQGLPQLRRLVLCSLNTARDVAYFAAEPLARAIAGLTALTHLDLARTPLRLQDASLARFLGTQHAALQELVLPVGVEYGLAGIELFQELMAGVATLPALHTLSFASATSQRDRARPRSLRAPLDVWVLAMQAWGHAVAALSTLRTLRFRHVAVEPAAMAEFAKAFCDDMRRSSTRSVEEEQQARPRKRVRESAGVDPASACPMSWVVDLCTQRAPGGCGGGSKPGVAARQSALRVLDLGQSHMENSAMRALMPALAHMPHLTHLDLSGCVVDAKARSCICALAQVVLVGAEPLSACDLMFECLHETLGLRDSSWYKAAAVQGGSDGSGGSECGEDSQGEHAAEGAGGGAAGRQQAPRALQRLQVLSLDGSLASWELLRALEPVLRVLPALRELGVRIGNPMAACCEAGVGVLRRLQRASPGLDIQTEFLPGRMPVVALGSAQPVLE